jgi:hypothetical protein
MLKGFISAPLLGTLVFLGAVVFVVHITQMEKAEVSSIVSDIYHNRVTSMLEDYRYDMGSLFAVALSRAIERYLSSECWEIFALKNDNYAEPGGADGGGIATRGVPPAGFPKTGHADYNYDDFGWCRNTGTGANPTCSDVSETNKHPNNPNYDYLCAENCNGQLDYYELRYKKCTEISDIIRDGICPYDPKYGLTAWLNATRTPFNFEGVGFSLSNPELVETYVSQISCTFSGLGTVTNTNMFEYDLGSSSGSCKGRDNCKVKVGNGFLTCAKKDGVPDGTLSVGDGIKNCRQLVGDSLFDCRNFAEDLGNPYRCCSLYSNTGECCAQSDGPSKGCDQKSHVMPGCDGGSFFVGVNVLANDNVYRSLPRVNATDKGGNEIQGGALGDRNFTIHVKYPVYKYLDAAFRTYMPIAYGICVNSAHPEYDFEAPVNMRVHEGQGGGTRSCPSGNSPQSDFEGIIEGLCYGESCGGFNVNPECLGLNPPAYCDTKGFEGNNNGQHFRTREKAIEYARAKFLGVFLSPDPAVGTSVCRLFRPLLCDTFGLCDTKMLIRGMGLQNPADGSDGFYTLCPQPPASWDSPDWTAIQAKLSVDSLFRAYDDCTRNPNNHQACAAVNSLSFTIKFVDKKAETLVNPIANNFCWHMRPVHVNPTKSTQ